MWSIYYGYSHVNYVNKELSIVNFHIFDKFNLTTLNMDFEI